MFTPRHLRKSFRQGRNGPGKEEKSRAFRAAKKTCDQFIHQSASMLESPKLANRYAAFTALCGLLGTKALRKGS